jgi:mannose-6-phosphate isomerase-like protein (cupin superfamily)
VQESRRSDPPRPGTTLVVMGDRLRFLATAAGSGGAFTAIEVTMRAGGGPPSMHAHDPAELVVVSEGALTAFRGSETLELGPGDAATIPGGTAHTIRNLSDAPARYVTVFSPPGSMESFLVSADALLGAAPDGPPSPALIASVLALAEEHGMTMFPPPGGGPPAERSERAFRSTGSS